LGRIVVAKARECGGGGAKGGGGGGGGGAAGGMRRAAVEVKGKIKTEKN